MTPLRLGIVGAGSIVAKKHLLALAEVPEIAVVGLCRRDAGELQVLADRFRIPRRYTDYRDLLGDPGIDAVLVATGPRAQPEVLFEAAGVGKHVFAEKPMAETAAEARALAVAIREAGIHFQIGFNKRFYFGYRTAQDLIRAGELGALTGFHARFWFQPGRAAPLLHNGIHFLDLARFFMGPVDEVLARRAEPQASATTTAGTWAVSLRFGSGAVGNLLLSSLASWDYVNEHVDLVGSNHNALSVENGRVVRAFRHDEARRAQLCENTLSGHWWSGNEEQGFTGQFRVFAQGVFRARRELPGPEDPGILAAGAEDGVRALELLEAMEESAAKGRSISLPVGGAEANHSMPLAGGRQRKVSP
jgi:myo-inositol 2-dehydrogenase / D-chiro-inositol 1-dehydrogenase